MSVGSARSGSKLRSFDFERIKGPGTFRLFAPMRVGDDGRDVCLEGAPEREGDPGMDIYIRAIRCKKLST